MTDAKSQRYDRQWRLWGDAGQSAIENAKICLLNGTATGTETLKNLILPGVAEWTIVDHAPVTPRDTGNNFFVEVSKLGKNRAEVTTELLQELNPFTKGFFVAQDPRQLIVNQPEFFSKFTLIITSQLEENYLTTLGKICERYNIPLIAARSYGFVGQIRIQSPEHCVIESKPDIIVDDLRLLSPFPELLNYANSFDLKSLSDEDLAHVPYPVILIQALQSWRQQNNSFQPKTDKEKEQFKAGIQSLKRTYKENNIDQALEKIYMASSNPNTTYFQVRRVLEDEKAQNLTNQSTPFWFIANAVRQFYQKHQCLPVLGRVPDIVSSSQNYINLQNIYRNKAQADLEEVKRTISESLTHFSLDQSYVPDSMVELFCKNNVDVRVVRYRTIDQEYSSADHKGSDIGSEMKDPKNIHVFYVLMRAVDRFKATHGQYPRDMENHVDLLKQQVDQVLAELGIPDATVPIQYIGEMVRYGGSELHNIAAFIGGVASQEAIKIITKQLIPLNNTFVFCGINSTSIQFEA